MAGALSGITDKLSALFSRGGGSAIGLSIGSSQIKLVELIKHGNQWKLMHFGLVKLPEGTIENREIVNQLAVVEALRSLLDQLKLKNKHVCTAISGNSIIIKRLSLDVPTLKELPDQVQWEAEQYIPYDINEVALDFAVLSRAKDNLTDTLVVAAKRSVLESYVACINDTGLQTKVVDVDFFAMQNVYEANYSPNPSESVALIDIGASATKITIVADGIPVFTKDTTSIAGRALTSDIQKHLSLSFDDAEAIKVGEDAEAVPQEVNDLMNLMNENIAMEVKRTIDFYNASSSGSPVTLVLLCGGSARILGLAEAVERKIGIPTQFLNPFQAIDYDASVFTPEYLDTISSVAAVPVGLALRAGAK